MSEPLRESRRTTVITLVSSKTNRVDVIRACEPECRNEILMDLGVPHGRGGGWLYRSKAAAVVTVAWSGIRYHVSWKRVKATALPCDHCGDQWVFRMPELIALAAERSAAQKGVLSTGLVPFPARQGAPGPSGAVLGAPGPERGSQGCTAPLWAPSGCRTRTGRRTTPGSGSTRPRTPSR
jgi:hypothetical protein